MKTKHGIVVSAATSKVGVIAVIVAGMVLGAAARADNIILAGTPYSKPDTAPPLPLPHYDSSLPLWFIPANEMPGGTLTSSYVPATGDIQGQVTSTVFKDPMSGDLGFQYKFTSTGTSELVRANVGGVDAPWSGWGIDSVGADGSGKSTSGSVPPVWSNGDPEFILREVGGQGLAFQFRAAGVGTSLHAGDSSSDIFAVVDASGFKADAVGLADGGAVSGAHALVPTSTSVPLPAAGWLLLSGLGLLGGLGRRRKADC